MVQATEAALADAHLGRAALDQVDTLVVVRSFGSPRPTLQKPWLIASVPVLPLSG